MTRLIGLADAAAWCGVDPDVVLSFMELAGKPVLDRYGEVAEIGGGPVYLEVDSAFAEAMGL